MKEKQQHSVHLDPAIYFPPAQSPLEICNLGRVHPKICRPVPSYPSSAYCKGVRRSTNEAHVSLCHVCMYNKIQNLGISVNNSTYFLENKIIKQSVLRVNS